MCKKEFASIRILRRRRYFVHLLHETDFDGGGHRGQTGGNLLMAAVVLVDVVVSSEP